MQIIQPPIEKTSGAGLVCRLYMMGGRQRELARRHLRRRYSEGVQLAFAYHDGWSRRLQLLRLRRFMQEKDD
jgi:hypothetical protein